ncbi:MAG: hypothetical protein L0Z62_17335 [Gemmataceae bacterium]|nr:hypothetical protein [Gemmataceae bacterium]
MSTDHPSEPEQGNSPREHQAPQPAFVLWPLAQATANGAWQLIYQLALHHALAATARRPRPDLFSVWN